MAKINIKNLHYVVMDTEDTSSANPVYNQTIKKPTVGMVSVDLNVNITEAELYADGILWTKNSDFKSAECSLTLADLPMEMQAEILGHTYDSTDKTLIKKAGDVAPYVALGFEFEMQDNSKMCIWMYKGKANPVSMSGETKGENISYGTNDLSITFAALKGAGDNTGRWQYCKEFAAGADTTSFYSSIPLATVTP